MNRGNVIGVALAAAAVATVIAVRACAGPPADAPVRLASAPASSANAVDPGQPGVNSTVRGRPRPAAAAGGKVEVNEVFWYGCGHCYALDPALESWKASKPA